MAGMDDHVAVIGDWVPPTPSPRTLFSTALGEDFGSKSFSKPPSAENGNAGLYLGHGEPIFPSNHDRKDAAQNEFSSDQFTKIAASHEQKLNSRGSLVERLAARAGFNAPRLDTETIKPADLSARPTVRSPYLTIPPGLSPTTLLESPVFLSNSLAQPSPTTGQYPCFPNGNSRSYVMTLDVGSNENPVEDLNTSSFSFKAIPESGSSFSFGTATKISQVTRPQHQQCFPRIDISVQSMQSQTVDPLKVRFQENDTPSLQSDMSRSFSQHNVGVNTIAAGTQVFDIAGGTAANSPPTSMQQDREEGDQRGGDSAVGVGAGGGSAPSEDGYNWRKYGQKQVKGSEYPRSYYKCTHPNCQVKKKVERSYEGHITEIIYKGAHNHSKPPVSRRSAIGSSNPTNDMQLDIIEQPRQQSGADGNDDAVWSTTQKGTALGTQPEWRHENLEVTSSASVDPEYCNPSATFDAQNGTKFETGDVSSTLSNEEDEDDHGTHGSVSLGLDDKEGDESESKRRKIEAYAAEVSGASRAIREPRVVVQTTSEVDILDDGYRWRKYGQKVVKGNPNPRSYYKCTNAGCTVRKHVERASHDLKSVITTYEGKHNHDVPAARNSSHVNSAASAQAAVAAVQPHVLRPEPPQINNGLAARFEGHGASLGSFSMPGQRQLGPSAPPGFSFGMMSQPGLVNLAMAGLGVVPGTSQARLPDLPAINPYLGQQRQLNELAFVLPKEPKGEPTSDLGLNLPNGASVYHQIMSRNSHGHRM